MFLRLLILALPSLIAGECIINLDGLTGDYPPLLLQDGDFKYPTRETEDGKRILSLDSGEELELLCHGSAKNQETTYLKLEGETKQKGVRLVCVGADLNIVGTQDVVDVEAASCNKKQEPRISRSNELCAPIGADGRFTELSGKLVRVSLGWEINGIYKEQIGMCVDEQVYGTIWTNHTIHGASILLQDKDPKRPGFKTDTTKNKRFFPWTTSTGMNTIYTKKRQAYWVKKDLGTNNKFEGETIIQTGRSGSHYFAKGHLAPDAAFVYNVEQDATYYFTNVAPQFQSFNNGNWKALEYNTRDLATKLGRDLKVTTGTSGVLQYPDNNDIPTNINLFNATIIPAPLYYWKVVEDPQTCTAAAFIGLNDPHRETPPTDLCTNSCKDMGWVDWDVNSMESGYMYCCSVEEARKNIPAIPASITATEGLVMGLDGGNTAGVSENTCTAGGSENTCTAGPCSCSCSKKQGVYTCTCTCNEP